MGQILNRIFRITKSNFNISHNDNDGYYDDESQLKRIIDELNNHQKNDETDELNDDFPYSILKIEKSASIEEIKLAYKERIKEYHPDRLHNFGEEIQRLAIIKTKQINLAYSLIKEKKHF